ncbi:5-(carboxyamino)imidazole ribonucleotide mutase [Neomoorella mulderi]|uniref:N5-carboxyaminoimidazole ribonucleotide mutase n=1 Tax=Moorella mulderi DSM 14980 TaxID=1122241 RepID=A0A151AWS4_9FIRM|nr:5-(carboxyamino)imidazole ribonucleotide mutase [Moorella mulderi]KYH32003.1 N5-carboxyaminoimidazole ribonucleotide mutase [Moorella mulderi DSM 14980]
MNLAHVGIVMGSDSDLPVMAQAASFLERFQIPYEVRILSAHRSPDAALEYARNAAGRGLKVLIAGAGGAAHLAGVLAAVTTLPVIGVPIKTAALGGVDSLYAMVQMPKGIPVATVAIDGAANAAILAAQILAVHDPQLKARLAAYKAELAREVAARDAKLAQLGIEGYLREGKK